MIGQCIKCGNCNWDKEINGNTVRCPKCGHTWEKRTLPLFILTGCSGVGKTTTAQYILQKKLALANKESLVCAGDFVMQLAEGKNTQILPVDSEHCAIFQCLRAGKKEEIKREKKKKTKEKEMMLRYPAVSPVTQIF